MLDFDTTIADLHQYRPARIEPEDFDTFWQQTIADSRKHELNAVFSPVNIPFETIDVFDVSFSGFNGHRIKGWFLRPRDLDHPLPCIIEFMGYRSGRGQPYDHLLWSAAGYAHFIMDTRGQPNGDTPDLAGNENAYIPGYTTQGILNPASYYYRRVFTDAVRAVEATCTRDDVDKNRVSVAGISQGGGIALATAALSNHHLDFCIAEAPFLCHFRYSVPNSPVNPYQEIAEYLQIKHRNVERVFNTLDYFNCVNFAPRIHSPCLLSVGLLDNVCLPHSIFAVYNHLNVEKQMYVYPYNGHLTGVTTAHVTTKLQFVKDLWQSN